MDSIVSIFEKIGLEKLINYLKELVVFYLKPVQFYKNFFQKPGKEKAGQMLTYSLLIISLGVILLEKETPMHLLKAFIQEMSVLFLLIIIVYISNILSNLSSKTKIRLVDVISFAIIAKMLLAPLQLLFFGLFINRENYDYLLLHNLIVVGIHLFVIFISARLFNQRVKFILLSIFLNLTFTNLAILLINKLSIDKFSTLDSEYYYSDQIMKERMEKEETLLVPYKVPFERVVYKTKRGIITYFNYSPPVDSTLSNPFNIDKKFKKNLKDNIELVDSIIPNLSFERNKIFFRKLRKHLISIDSLLEERAIKYTEDDVISSSTVYIDRDSSEVMRKLIIPVASRYVQTANELMEEHIRLSTMSLYSYRPFIIFSFLFPVTYILDETESD